MSAAGLLQEPEQRPKEDTEDEAANAASSFFIDFVVLKHLNTRQAIAHFENLTSIFFNGTLKTKIKEVFTVSSPQSG